MSENIHKVYESIQPVNEPTPRVEGVEIYMPNKNIYDGEFTLTEGYNVILKNEKLASYKMVVGTDRSLYGLLKKNTDIFPNGPYHLDSRDDGVEIHNHKFNQSPKYVYTYNGGNGELIDCNINTSKKNTLVQAEQSTKLDLDTKHITTTVSQSCNDSDKDLVNKSKDNTEFQKELWAKLNNKPYQDPNSREAIIQSAKSEKATIEELKSTYQVTKQDIENYMAQAKSKFKELYENAKTTGDISPLLKSNSIKTVVKVKRYVRETVVPSSYSTVSGVSFVHQYHSGMDYLKNNSNIIYLGVKRNYKDQPFPYAEIITEKEFEIELDGARIFSSPLAQDFKDPISLNNISDKVQKQFKCNARFIGRPGLVTSIVIYLNNISKKYTGEWYTKKVTHTINQSGYFCDAEMIRKEVPVTLSQVRSTVDTKSIYKELHKLASDRVKYDRDVEADIKNAFLQYVKENPEMADKSLVVDMNQYDQKTGSVPVYPATDDVVNITEEREKHRR